MNKKLFESLPLPWQNPQEWFLFLNFVESYFDRLGIMHSIVLELGVYENKQKAFYEALGAKYIGIDCESKSNPTILGKSNDPGTLERLKDKLDGRMIDLLFIDASHRLEDVQEDYKLYSPLVTGLIAFHDIFNYNYDVVEFWDELTTWRPGMSGKTFVTINAKEGYANHGIGIVIGEEVNGNRK